MVDAAWSRFPAQRWPRRLPSILLLIAAGMVPACTQPPTRFELISYRAGYEPQRFHEVFDECYYALDDDGNLDVIARRATDNPADGVGHITQIVHLKSVYRAVPGATPSDPTTLNGLINYAVLTDAGGSCYEGGGAVFASIRRIDDTLVGKLDGSKLRPTRHVGSRTNLLERAELEGHFRARRDRGRVVRILNELDRVFGPHPRFVPPPPDREPF